MSKPNKGQKTTKVSRKRWCQAYRAANKRMANKVRKVMRHLKHQPNDSQAREWLEANS